MKNSSSLVSIIILNFNGGKMVLDCINSIYETKNILYEIILIDNASNDDSLEQCKKNFSNIKIIENEKNIGLGARNSGIKVAQGEFVVFLDFDTIVEPYWLENLLTSFNNHGNGLYQPKLLEKERPKIFNSAGNMLNIFGMAYSRGKGEQDIGQYDQFTKISYTSGACTFTSKENIEKIGEIEPMFFAYHDDVDYGWRALLLNINSYYEPSSVVYHYGSKTLKWTAKKFYLLERNRWICLKTLYSPTSLKKILPYLIIIELGISIFFMSKGIFQEKIRAFLSLIKLKKELKSRRHKIEKTRICRDEKIIEHFVDDFYLPSKNGQNNKSFFTKTIENLSKKARISLNK